MKKAGVADLGGVLRELDIDPGDDVAEWAVPERPPGPFRRLQVRIGQLIQLLPPGLVKSAHPLAYRSRAARPGHLLAGERPVAEGMIERHGPPEADVPGQPGDAGGAEVVALVLGPVGAPFSRGEQMHLRPRRGGTPETFFGAEPFEVEAGKLPCRVELADEVVVQEVPASSAVGCFGWYRPRLAPLGSGIVVTIPQCSSWSAEHCTPRSARR